jgi:hypothetical protein
MRIRRTTDGGTTYDTSLKADPSPETLAALDQVAEAAKRHLNERQVLLQATRDHLATLPPGTTITPADLQRELRLGWNTACSMLEALQRDGELARVGLSTLLTFVRPSAPPAGSVDPGYALPLSSKEHGALLRLLDGVLDWQNRADLPTDAPTLRAIRAKLKRPQ